MARLNDIHGLRGDDGPGRRSEADQREADLFLAEITAMRDDGQYDWCWDTLEGIHESVSSTGYVTARQREAVDNIRNTRRRSRGRW